MSTDLIAQMYPDAAIEKPAASSSPVGSTDSRIEAMYGNSGTSPVKVTAAADATPSRVDQIYGSETPTALRPVTAPQSKEQSVLDLLYPSSKPAPVAEVAPAEPAPVEPAAEPVEEVAESVEVAPVGNRYSLDPGGTENLLYGETERTYLTPESFDLSIIYSDPDEQAALHDTLEVIAGLTGAAQDSMNALIETVNTELLAPGEQQSQEQTLSDLYRTHGPALHQDLADARALVQSLPDVSAWFETTGLGDNPAVIKHILRIAKSPRSQQRIQQLRDLA